MASVSARKHPSLFYLPHCNSGASNVLPGQISIGATYAKADKKRQWVLRRAKNSTVGDDPVFVGMKMRSRPFPTPQG